MLGYASDDESAAATRREVREYGVSCRTVRADLTTDEGIDALFLAAADNGQLDAVVNNAGATLHVGTLVETLAEVIPQGIRVVGVAPGTVSTDIHAQASDPDRLVRVAAAHPMGRAGRPEEIAGVVAFALSEDASYTTGTTICVAGRC